MLMLPNQANQLTHEEVEAIRNHCREALQRNAARQVFHRVPSSSAVVAAHSSYRN
jgi:hypothetical protein